MTDTPTTSRPPTLFFLGLSLLERFREREEAWVEALPGLVGKVDGILLVVPSWQEAPDALCNNLVRRIATTCSLTGNSVNVYWGRRLWITWANLADYPQHKWDVYDPAYYAAFLSRLAAEAKAIGALGTFAECEPYGDKLHTEWFKRDGFGSWNRRKVLKAIQAAKRVAPAATMAYPAGSMDPRHYSWPMRNLGKEFLHSKTYKVQDPAQVRLNPPSGYAVNMDWWGSWVTTTGDGKTGPLTVEQYQDLSWDDIRMLYNYPGLKGSWIFTAVDDRLAVMQVLSE